MKKVLLVDGNNILHRAYHGLPLLKTADGRYTNAVFGFLKMLNSVMEKESPTHIAVCFDKGKETFRHKKYSEYKANRKPADPELAEQFPLIREVVRCNGWLCLESAEYEADDLMGTLAKKAAAEGNEAVIFSGDRDLLQVLDKRISVISGKKQLTDMVKTTEEDFRVKYGFEPRVLIDMKGLMGDASDNYPGVRGVGEKTATKLLQTYGSLDGVYAHLDEMPKNKLREKLEADKENAELSRYLAEIVTDIPLDLEWDALIPSEPDYSALYSLYKNLEFKGMLKDLEGKIQKQEQDNGLFSGDLFDTVNAELPFELATVNHFSELEISDEVGLLFENGALYAGLEGKACKVEENRDFSFLKQILEDESVNKYCADLKDIHHYCMKNGINAAGIKGCPEIAAYLIDSSAPSYQVSSLLGTYLKVDSFLFEENKSLAEVSMLPRLCRILEDKLESDGMLKLYTEVELPLAAVLADMEFCGIRVEKSVLDDMSRELGAVIEDTASNIRELAGEDFNLNSPKQLSVILFDKLGLPKGKKTKTGYSTNNETLEGLRGVHPVIDELLKYRQLSKLKSTYTDAIGKLISADTGHVHTKFLQTVTATGRLSSADPNLQNIPVRVEEGRKIRKAFFASDENHILLAADYSQIELRLLAHFAGDGVLIDSFVKEEDIHRRTAGEIFGVPAEKVTSDMRRVAKTVNFGIIYGMSSYSLGNDLGVSRKTAQDYIDGYFGRYPNVKNYLDGTVKEAKECGYAQTLMGRRRYLPDLNSKNFNLRSFAERTAMNTPLQGSAADIIKLVMVRLYAALAERGLKSKMILQVHDELILDCPLDELEEVKVLLKDIMENTVQLKVPLTVDMKCGPDWYGMEKITE